MNIHPTHTLTRNGHNGLCDPWQRCMACNGTDRTGDGRLAAECQAQDTALAALRVIDAGDNTVAKRAAARIEELEAQVAELREAARGQIVVVETARKALRDAEHVIEYVARTATNAKLTYAERVSVIANHPYVYALMNSKEGCNG